MEIYTGKLPDGFLYIPQDNYLFCNPEKSKYSYLYSDSATSCIILVLIGKSEDEMPLVGVAHLSTETRMEAFFRLAEERFCGGFAVYAQGANPPFPMHKKGTYSYDALENARLLLNWITSQTSIPNGEQNLPKSYINHCTLALGMGDPNSGCGAYGIDIDPQSDTYLKVSSKNFYITPDIRDPEGGLQTLYSIFGRVTKMPSLVLHQADKQFSEDEKNSLVKAAKERNWLNLLELSPEELLDRHSTTPEFEPSWFCETLINSVKYVRDYNI
jgi:hypothetical protein